MKFTRILQLFKPEQDDFYNVDDFNANFEKLDEYAGKMQKTIDELPETLPSLMDFENITKGLQVEIDKKADKTQIPTTLPANGGRADTAAKLQTPRTINGVAFDGSANITVTASANGGNSNTANVAKRLGKAGGTDGAMAFHWSGQGGQPSWLWGGNDGTNHYVYNPSNFHVRNADTVGGHYITISPNAGNAGLWAW